MLLEYFNFFINCISQIFEIMKKFTLFRGVTYYNFFIFLISIPIFYKLIQFIFADDSKISLHDSKVSRMARYDELNNRKGRRS